MMRILVTGGTGFIGSHLVEALLKRNYEVTCLVRRTSNLKWLERLPVRYVWGDFLKKDSLREAVLGKDIIYHLAGATKSQDKNGYYQANFVATKNLIEVVKSLQPPTRDPWHHNLQRFVHISSLAAVGPGAHGEPVTEATLCHPLTDYGKSKLKGEEEVKKYFPHLPITIIRPPVVYGPRDRDLYLYFKSLNYGIKFILGARKYINLIHVQDLVEGIIQAAENESGVGKIYFMANDERYSMEYLAHLIAATLRKKRITLHIPDIMIYLLATISEYLAWLKGSPTIFNRQKALEAAQPYWVCNSSRARKELGFRQKITIQEGIQQTLDWYFQNKWL